MKHVSLFTLEMRKRLTVVRACGNLTAMRNFTEPLL